MNSEMIFWIRCSRHLMDLYFMETMKVMNFQLLITLLMAVDDTCQEYARIPIIEELFWTIRMKNMTMWFTAVLGKMVHRSLWIDYYGEGLEIKEQINMSSAGLSISRRCMYLLDEIMYEDNMQKLLCFFYAGNIFFLWE